MSLEQQEIGPYRIQRLLAYGGLGEVYLVEDTRSSRQEVLKLLRIGISSSSGEIRSFAEQARAIVQLSHPYILPLVDYGKTVVGGVQVPYVVMPFWPEGTLAQWLQQSSNARVLSPRDSAKMISQAADALQYAHDRGIIHQNVKPANFFIHKTTGGPPDLLLADLGIAQMAREAMGASQIERSTPTYMAPEQWEGHPVPATDQYALAIMLYEFLTGRPPFQGNREQLRYEHTSVLPAAPSTINPALSPWIDVVLLRALAKQPDERFPTISTFANVVAQALMPARPVATPVYQPVTPVVPQLQPLQQPPRRSGLSPGAIVIIVLVAILLPGFFGFLIYRVSRGSSTANTNANATSTAVAANNNATATARAVTASAPATATATILPAAQFNGTWNNTDTATTGITRLIITNSGSTISVHAYARCATDTGECDWGTQSGTYNGTPFIVTFKHAKLTDLLAISLRGSQLEVVDIGSNGTHTYLFNKA